MCQLMQGKSHMPSCSPLWQPWAIWMMRVYGTLYRSLSKEIKDRLVIVALPSGLEALFELAIKVNSQPHEREWHHRSQGESHQHYTQPLMSSSTPVAAISESAGGAGRKTTLPARWFVRLPWGFRSFHCSAPINMFISNGRLTGQPCSYSLLTLKIFNTGEAYQNSLELSPLIESGAAESLWTITW